MVIGKYHFHLGLHKMFVMFSRMFLYGCEWRTGRFHVTAAEQNRVLCVHLRLHFAGEQCNWGPNVDRNVLYMIIGALIVVVAGFSYYAYQEEKQPDGVEIKLNEQGLSVEGN